MKKDRKPNRGKKRKIINLTKKKKKDKEKEIVNFLSLNKSCVRYIHIPKKMALVVQSWKGSRKR